MLYMQAFSQDIVKLFIFSSFQYFFKSEILFYLQNKQTLYWTLKCLLHKLREQGP